MKKQDQERLQAEFLAAHASSGISPKEWCEEQGLNYNSARRYIKLPSAQTAQKSAQKKVRTAQKAKCAEPILESDGHEPLSDGENTLIDIGESSFDPSEFGLSEKQAVFAEAISAGASLIDAYRSANYKCQGNAAYVTASQLLRNPKVAKAVRYLRNRRQQRNTAELDELIGRLMSIIRADPNLLSQYRRVNCRYCWGENHFYQWRDIQEFEEAEEKASNSGKPKPQYGGLGFISNMDPNPECPRCSGEGEGQLVIGDTRDLEGNEHAYFLGVKQTKNGIEVITESKQAASAMLIKILETRRDNDAGSVMNVMPVPTTDSVDEWEKFAQAQQDKSLGK